MGGGGGDPRWRKNGDRVLDALYSETGDLGKRKPGQDMLSDPEKLLETRNAIRKLLEIGGKLENLMTEKLRHPFEKLNKLLRKEPNRENIENEIQQFSQAAINLIRITKKRERYITSFNETLKTFVKSESVSEISTLIGLTALTDYREYLDDISSISKICQKTIHPVMPRLMQLMDFAIELDRFCKWLRTVLNCNEITGEDDISRMTTAIRDLDLDSFDRIYMTLDQRIKVENRP
jgi:hypothetical protein